MCAPLLALLTGASLVSSIWGAVGVVVVFAAIVMIIFKSFVGAQKNIGAGVAGILAVGVVAFLASQPQLVIDAGKAIVGFFGIS